MDTAQVSLGMSRKWDARACLLPEGMDEEGSCESRLPALSRPT